MIKKYFFFLLLFILINPGLYAQWDGNPATVNNPVATDISKVEGFTSIDDNAGGIISVWQGNDSIYAQCKTVTGLAKWQSVTIPVMVEYAHYNWKVSITDVVPDNYGGAYIVWQYKQNDSTANIYLQRIGNGTTLFINKVQVNAYQDGLHGEAKLIADAGGVIVAWTKKQINSPATTPPFSYAQVFAQRFNLTGTKQWGIEGIQVSTATGNRTSPEIIADGENGAFIAFTDHRNSTVDALGKYNNLDVYAQHVSSAGSRLWDATDKIISTEALNQMVYINGLVAPKKSMVADSTGGFIIVYEGNQATNSSNPNLYAQRVNRSGNLLFANGGVAVSGPSPNAKPYLQLSIDGARGAVASWAEFEDNAGFLHAQHITSTGNIAWGLYGIHVNAAGDQDLNRTRCAMAADEAGNYFFTWHVTNNSGVPTIIKAQKINSAGILQWVAAGINVCTNPVAFPWAPDITRSGAGAIITWKDERNLIKADWDIYAAKVGADGILVTVIKKYNTVADGNWNDPAIWEGNVLPPADADVVIRNNVVANINVACNSLKVEGAGVFTVNTGINITVMH